jgi:hypothetical protein
MFLLLVLIFVSGITPDDVGALTAGLDSPPVVGDEIADNEVRVPFRSVEEDEAVVGVEDAPVCKQLLPNANARA